MARLTGNANSFTEISSVTATFGRVKSAEIFKSIAYNIPIGKVRSAVVVKNPNPIDSFSFDPNKISQFKVIGPTNPTPSINLANVAKLRAAQVLKNPSPNDAFLFDPNKISQFKVIGPTNPTPGINLADVAKLKAAQVLKASVPREDIYYDPYTIRQFKNVNNQIFYSPASDKLQNFDSVNWQLQYQPNVVVAGTLNNKTNTSYPVSQLLSTSRTASGSNQLISLSAGTYYGTFNSSRLSTAASTAFDFSGGTFTIEFWMNPLTSVVSAGNTCRILMFGTNGQANAYNVAINSDGSVSASIPLGGTTGLGTAPGVIGTNTWYHVAVVVSSGIGRIYINGELRSGPSTITLPTTGAIACNIGYDTVATVNFQYFGYMSNLRIVKGVAVYTGNFIPSGPLSRIQSARTNVVALSGTETSLLTFNSATVVDNSVNAFTFTPTGNAVTATVTSAYLQNPIDNEYLLLTDTTTNYQALTPISSVTISATSYVFTVPNSFISNLNSSNTWTVQLWDPELMPQSKVKTNLNPINARERLYYATLVNTKYGQFIPFKEQAIGQPNNILSSTLRQSKYQNFATLNSPLAVNDKLEVFSSTDWYRRDNSNIILVGSANTKSNPNNVINTMTSNTRTASGSNSLITVTSNTYYGSFSGAQSLTTPANAAFSFGAGDFTIEAWVYPTATPAVNGMIFGFRSGTDTSPYLFWTSTNQIIFGGDLTNFITYSPGLTLNTWTHIAVTRLGTNLRLFLNGIQVSSVSNSTNFSDASTKYIGGINGATPYYFTGFISNLRVVKGTAVYTGLFTPSSPLSRIQPARNNVAALTGAETSLLTFQSATVIDNSVNTFTITNPNSVTTTLNSNYSTLFATPFVNEYVLLTDAITNNQALAPVSAVTIPSTSSYVLTIANSYVTNLNNSNPWYVQLWDPEVIPQSKVITTLAATNPRETLYYVNLLRGNRNGVYFPGKNEAISPSNNISLNRVDNTILQSTVSTTLAPTNPRERLYYANLVKGKYGFTIPTFNPADIPRADVNFDVTPMTNLASNYWTYFNNRNKIAVGQPSGKLVNYSTVSTKTTSGSNTLLTINNPTSGINYITSGQTYYGTFNGSTQTLTITSSNTFASHASDFTVEAWIRPTAANNSYIFSMVLNSTVQTSMTATWYLTTGGFLNWYDNITGLYLTSTRAVPLNLWSHVAVVRENNTVKFYINGQLSGTATYPTVIIATFAVYIGSNVGTATTFFAGDISNFRMVKTSVYKGDFIPLGPLGTKQIARPNVIELSGNETSLLALQSAAVTTDNSINNLTIVNTGSISSPTLSNSIGSNAIGTPPQANEYALITDTVTGNQALAQINGVQSSGGGGTTTIVSGTYSGQFNGSSQSLSITANSSLVMTGDFTIECWFYFNSFGYHPILSQAYSNGATTGSWVLLHLQNGGMSFSYGGLNNGISFSGETQNAWNHVAVTRSGTTVRCYLNGTLAGSQTSSATVGTSTDTLYIGAAPLWLGSTFSGYISNIRIINGTALYTQSTLTVPTQTLTAVANTKLLTLQDDSIIDNSINNFTITNNGGVTTTPSVTPGLTTSTVVVLGSTSYTISLPTTALSNLNSSNTWAFSLWDPVIFPQNNVLTNTVPQTARERLYYATLAKGRYGLKYPYDQTASLANNVLVGKMRAVNVLKNPSPNDAIYYDAFNLQKQIQALKSPTQVPTNYRLSDFNAPYTYFNNTNKVAVGTYSSRLYNYSTISSKTTVGSNTALTVSNPSSGISFITNSQTYYASFNGSTPQLLQGSQSIGVITTGPFTIEAWVYPTTYSGSPFIVENTYWNAGNNGGWYLTINTNGTLGLGYSTATFNAYSSVNSTISVQTNVWSHIAVVRDINNFISFYINGQLANSPTLLSQSLNLDSVGVQTNYNTRIGAHIADSAVSNAFTGNISNVRIVPNRAVYTGPFVPLGPLSRTQISRQNVLALAGAETSLLALTTSTVTSDSSINNYTLTNNGAMTATLSQTLGTVPVANDFALITDTVTGNQALAQINSVSSNIISGSQLYTTSGASGSLGSASAPSPTGTQYLYTFTAPTGVTSVSVVAIGASGGGGSSNSGGGGGGGLGWKNNITVVPGQSYTVAVGGISSPSQNTIPGGDSYFISTSVVKGGGGTNGTGTSVGANAAGGTFTGDGGGNGGAGGNRQSSSGGGGGGGGYNGDGGAGANGTTGTIGAAGATNSGAGGGGSGADTGLLAGGFGGGVGVFGYTGVTGGTTSGISVAGAPGSGGVGSTYGGGAGGGPSGSSNNGVGGAVRIVWGPGRNFPSTNVSAETFISYSITVPTASLSNLNSSNTWTYSLWDPEVFSQQNVLTNLAPANARERLYYASLVKGKYGQSYPYYPWYALSNNVQLNKLADFNQQYWALSDNANKVAVGTANPRYTTVVRSSSVIISGQNTTINATSGANPQVANFRGTGNGTVGGSTYGYIQFTPAVTISWLNSFCIEFYVYFNTLPAGGYNILSTGSGDINENVFYITPTSMGITSPGYWNIPSPVTYSFGTGVWYHIAIMGAPNWTYFAVDGAVSSVNVAAGAGNGYSTTNNWYPNNFNFGGYTPITAGSVPMDHYVANFRITTGSTVYNTTGFARPTTIPTAITGTQILTMTTGLTDLSGQSRTITLTTQNGTTGNRPFMSSSPVNTPFVTVPAAYYYPNDQLLLTDTVTNNQALVTVTSCDFVSTVVVPTSQISNLNTANSWNMQLWSSDLFPQANVKTTLSPSTARERLYYAALAKGRYGLRYPYESPATLPDSLTLDNLRLYKTPNNGFITTSVDNTTPLAIINQIDWYSPANSKDAIAGSASTRQNITGQVLGINVGETTSTISFKSNAVWNYYPRANDYVLLTNDRTGVQSIAKILTISNNAGFNIVVPLGQALVAGDGTFTGTGVAITGSSANTYNFSWTCPDNIFSVSAVAVGAGGGGSSAYNNRGAGGGALAWSNGISVVPGQTYSITVGTGPVNTPGVTSTVTLGSVTLTAGGGGGPSGPGGTYSVTGTSGTSNTFGGGNGGSGSTGGNAGGGGGGAGGYGGAGGAGGNGLYDSQSGTPGDPGQPGTGGGGGGGGGSGTYGSGYGGGGGGVGLLGIGANGVGGARGPANGGPGGGGGGSGGTGFNVPTGGSYGGGGGGYGGGGGPGAVRIIWPALRIADGSTLRAFGNGTNIENALSTDQFTSIQESLLIFTATVATSEIQNIIDAPTCTIQPWDPSYIPQALVTTLFPPINPRERLYWTNLTSKYSSLTGVDANKDTTEVVYDRDTKGLVVKFRTAALGQGVQDPAYKSVAPIQFWN